MGFNVLNVFHFHPEHSWTLTQKYLSYDSENNVWHIAKGITAKITTYFTEDTTFTKVKYESSDQEVLIVGDDGEITPLTTGQATITATIDDGWQLHVSYHVKIEVDPQNLIMDLGNFFYLVRKGLGHFGAFLITGIFSTLLFTLMFDDLKHLIFTVPLNFLQGFFLAEITEFIQLFTPERFGTFSDVIIDFSGFACAAVSITLLLLLYFLIRAAIQKSRKKKANEYQTKILTFLDE